MIAEKRSLRTKAKKEDVFRFEQMDPSISRRGAEPVYCDKKGGDPDLEEIMKDGVTQALSSKRSKERMRNKLQKGGLSLVCV
ncbi:hypothetical protein HS088_TW07G01254 [Tripterygium wilfordii]|uniref:Uncharacterized protein n=1 Tax=Tripterygium wilfordii TaxID=458696 RepID=A0A7J7DH42_TRIWF|nr:hypothetical protein HS088_TW07G01254 [Tripterygium wilfordii]